MMAYSVIAILSGRVEQFDLPEEASALRKAKELVARGAALVEIYDARDELAWSSTND